MITFAANKKIRKRLPAYKLLGNYGNISNKIKIMFKAFVVINNCNINIKII